MRDCTLTICSVSFHSRDYLEMNWALVRHLNPSDPLRWLVAENSPPGSVLRLETRSDHFHVVAGTPFEPDNAAPGSYHHATALNKLLALVETRFVLILDPDFYIIRKSWMADVLAYMQAHELALLGVPWHPSGFAKFRYFPCAHCLFIDLDRVDRSELDFRPDYDEITTSATPSSEAPPPTPKSVVGAAGPWLKRWLPPAVLARLREARARLGASHAFIQRLSVAQRRRAIGTSRDTGYRLYRRYAGDSRIRFACFTPVYRLTRRDWIKRSLDLWLPDHLSYYPRRRGYFSQIGFAELLGTDTTAYGWEEFLWQGAPFGFHVRGQQRNQRDRQAERVILVHLLNDLAGMRPTTLPLSTGRRQPV